MRQEIQGGGERLEGNRVWKGGQGQHQKPHCKKDPDPERDARRDGVAYERWHEQREHEKESCPQEGHAKVERKTQNRYGDAA